jgi:primosomal protein N' (replication factor Y) (superfamily II helicase)
VIARVVVDVPAVEKLFDYVVPDAWRDHVGVGTIVRVELHGRRVRGWVVDLVDEAAPGVEPKPLAKVTGAGPPPEVVDLATWAAWRWAGRWVHLLRVASPPAVAPPATSMFVEDRGDGPEPVIRRVAPAVDRLPLVRDAVAAGPAIVVVPSVDLAVRLARRLRAEGHRIALHAGDVTLADWVTARQGEASIIGTRVAVWTPVPDAALRQIVVLDEHDDALQSESAPTWHGREVAVERARRAGIPCTLVSPVPTAHALAVGRLQVARQERAGWPVVEVADRRREDPARAGLFSPRLATLLHDTRGDGRVVCVLNRLGRSRLLACRACGAVAACRLCGAAVAQPDAGVLLCGACGEARPVVCADCGSGRFRNIRAGVKRVREELEALAGETVVEVTGAAGDPGDARIAVGTEAVLHRLRGGSVAVVAFLDLDQELLAPRYCAAEQTLALVARAARAVGGRNGGGRILLQTRQPDHAVVRAAIVGDPGRFAAGELERRRALRYPPAAALALVSGAGASEWAATATDGGVLPLGLEVLGPADGRWLVRAPDPKSLADWLATVPRPQQRLRIEVDPPRA